MKPPRPPLPVEYRAALHDYLRHSGETALARAYELGRRALDDGLGILDMTVMQQEALGDLLSNGFRDQVVPTLGAVKRFFVESLSPFEMTHRSFREANAALRGLNEKMEEEVRRIAHRLHDDAGQMLSAVSLALDEAVDQSGNGEAPKKDRFQKVWHLLAEVQEQVRSLSHEMRPVILDDLGLGPALESLAHGMGKRTGLNIEVEYTGQQRLPDRVETAIYRVAQEALINVARHARASRATVRLAMVDGRVRCSVQDDGIGFDPQQAPSVLGGGLGLIGIRERLQPMQGSFEVRTQPGAGTEIIVSIPLVT